MKPVKFVHSSDVGVIGVVGVSPASPLGQEVLNIRQRMLDDAIGTIHEFTPQPVRAVRVDAGLAAYFAATEDGE